MNSPVSTAKGRLYVFEGADGCGKTTLAGHLARWLGERGVAVDLLAFPGREAGTLGQHVNVLHHDPAAFGIEELFPASLQLLHVAAHLDTIERRIRPALAAGRTVVLDRYWWSTWVYGRVAGVAAETLEAMIAIERAYWAADRPDAVFLINRHSPLKAESLPSWQAHVAEYLELADREAIRGPVFHVANEARPEDAFARLLSLLPEMTPSGDGHPDHLDATAASLNAGVPDADQPWLPITSPLAPCSSAPVAWSPHIFVRLSPAKPTAVYASLWRFAVERQAIFFRRLEGQSAPWTNDPTLRAHKFTNAYRASDRVSQYLIRQILYGDGVPAGAEETFFRTLLFKLFNRVATWERLRRELGEPSWAAYRFEDYDRVLSTALAQGERLYSAAYIMPSGGRATAATHGGRKHRMHLRLLEAMMRKGLPARLAQCTSMREAFTLLRTCPTVGDFLAYQYVTDLNYGPVTDFDEMSFVVAGPGARDGLRKCFSDFGGLGETDLIKLITDRQEQDCAALGLSFRDLWGRPLQLIDCQNLLCEVSKYARVVHPEVAGLTGRTRIKQRFRHTAEPISYWYPPKWGINQHLPAGG